MFGSLVVCDEFAELASCGHSALSDLARDLVITTLYPVSRIAPLTHHPACALTRYHEFGAVCRCGIRPVLQVSNMVTDNDRQDDICRDLAIELLKLSGIDPLVLMGKPDGVMLIEFVNYVQHLTEDQLNILARNDHPALDLYWDDYDQHSDEAFIVDILIRGQEGYAHESEHLEVDQVLEAMMTTSCAEEPEDVANEAREWITRLAGH